MSTELAATEPDDNKVSADTDTYLRADAIVEAINANLPDGVQRLPKLPKNYTFKRRDAADVALAFHSAFELSGGAPALLLWAMNNPDKFYPLFAKFANTDIPNAAGNTFVFQTAIPANAQDRIDIGPLGQVVQVPAIDADTDEVPA